MPRAMRSPSPGNTRRTMFTTTVSTTDRTSDTTSQFTVPRFARPQRVQYRNGMVRRVSLLVGVCVLFACLPGQAAAMTVGSRDLVTNGRSDGPGPEKTGPTILVSKGSNEAGSWTLSAYRATTGVCLEVSTDASGGAGLCTVEGRRITLGLSGGTGGSALFGTAPKRATSVRVEYADGTTVTLPARSKADFDMSFFATRRADERAVARVIAFNERGKQVAEFSVGSMRKPS